MVRPLLKALAVLLVILNLKSLPFAFHIRFYYILVKHFYVRRKIKPKSIFQTISYVTHTPLMEMDFNLHKSNSTYFSDLDMARSEVMMSLFKDYYLYYRDPQVSISKSEWPNSPLGGVVVVFRKEISPYRWYKIKSRILGWDNKWLFVLSRFESADGKMFAVSLAKYVFKLKRKTVSPREVVEFCGLASESVLKQGEMDFEKAEHLLHLEALEHEKIE
jgi:hypothetical protein